MKKKKKRKKRKKAKKSMDCYGFVWILVCSISRV